MLRPRPRPRPRPRHVPRSGATDVPRRSTNESHNVVIDRERRMTMPSVAAWNTAFDGDTQAKINKLEPADQRLYRVCVAHGWSPRFVWLPHQPAAVRFVAGIETSWPREYPPTSYPRGKSNGGGILADGMGLGKTVEGIGGVVVREILALHCGVPAARRASLVVAPNVQVMEQWLEHLIKAGISAAEIGVYDGDRHRKHGILRACGGDGDEDGTCLKPPRFTLMTKDVLMGDIREMVTSFHETRDAQKALVVKSSPLIPHTSAKHAFWLYEKYLADKGKKPDRKWVAGKPDGTCVSEICAADRAQRIAAGLSEPKWLMLINDEAHFERNQLAFWGLMLTLLGTHCSRVILATGTPYNNKNEDLASLCAYYDTTLPNKQNNVKWWDAAMGKKPPKTAEGVERLKRELARWRGEEGEPVHWLRRTMKDISMHLPPRATDEVRVLPSEAELNAGYLEVEKNLIKVWRQLMVHLSTPRPGGPAAAWRWNQKRMALMDQLLGLMQKARMLMIHPVVGYNGREVTRLFAPSRRSALGEKAARYCVCCLPSGIAKPIEVKPEKEHECTCVEDKDGNIETCEYCTKEEEAERAAEAVGGRAEVVDADSAEGDAKQPEKRLDTDGQPYTLAEFVEFYGKASGTKNWRAATKVPTVQRWYKEGAQNPADAVPGLDMLIRACSETTELGPLVKLTEKGACGAASKHFVHLECKRELLAKRGLELVDGMDEDEEVEEEKATAPGGEAKGLCPRCCYLRELLHTGAGPLPDEGDGLKSDDPMAEPAEAKMQADEVKADEEKADEVKAEVKAEEQVCMMCVNDEDGHPICDANGVPFGGFKPSTKLLKLKELVEAIPKADKLIVFSFFKAFLDLAEAMLEIEMGISCGRFDGDCSSQKDKSAVLHQFKEADGPRALLATIQSGGTGLNITVANHVIFADRWFNPQTMEQAICRVDRIGQTKPTQITYIDAAGTFDEAVKSTCEAKLKNSEMVLCDGKTAIGSQQSDSMVTTAGILGNKLKEVFAARTGRADYELMSGRARSGRGGAGANGGGGGSGDGGASPSSSNAPEAKVKVSKSEGSHTENLNPQESSKRRGKRPVPVMAASSGGGTVEVDLTIDDDDEPSVTKLPKRQASVNDVVIMLDSDSEAEAPTDVDSDVGSEAGKPTFIGMVSREARDAAGRAKAIDIDADTNDRMVDASVDSERAVSELMSCFGCGHASASEALKRSGGDVQRAAVLLLGAKGGGASRANHEDTIHTLSSSSDEECA